MIEFIGAISITVAAGAVIVFFWRRRTFLGTRNVTEYGASIPTHGLPDPVFLGATDTTRGYDDAVDLAEAILEVEG